MLYFKLYVPPEQIKVPDLFIVGGFSPEPTERLQFIVGIIIFPLLLLSSSLSFSYFIAKRNEDSIKKLSKQLYFAAAIVVLIAAYFSNLENDFFYLTNNYFYKNFVISLPLFLIIVLLLFYVQKIQDEQILSKKILFIIFDLFVALIISIIFIKNLFTIYNIDDTWRYAIHFSAFFYPISQVFAGKALLVDLINQYGLYPHFLEPIFRITGLSIFKLTLLMSTMICFSFLAVYKFLREAIRNRLIMFLGFCFFIFYGYLFMKLIDPDPYFQFYPLRIFFPAVSIYLTWRYFKNKNKILYYSSFVLYSIASLWNSDSGFVVFLSWLLVILFSELKNNDTKEVFKKIFIHVFKGITIYTAVFLTYFLYIKLRYGSFPNISLLFEYQKLFYKYGFSMMPMELIKPWNIVIFVYIAGLAHSVKKIIARNINRKDNIVFFLSILGVGLFSYYQGRSHDYNLAAVWYPAILLIIMYLDSLWQAIVKEERNIAYIAVFTGLFYLFSSAFFSLARGAVIYYNNPFNAQFKPKATYVTKSADFIRRYAKGEKEVVVLSYNAGIYHLMSNTASPVKVPSLPELLLKKDQRTYDKYFSESKDVKIFIDTNILDWGYNYYIGYLRTIFKNYQVKATSSNRKIIYVTKKKSLSKKDIFETLFPPPKDASKTVLHLKTSKSDQITYFDAGTNDFYGFRSNGMPPISLNKDFTIEFLVKPNEKHIVNADILGNHPGKNDFEGFVVQQAGDNQNVFTFGYGNGKEWLPNATFKLDELKWNYIVITVENNIIRVFKNSTLVSKVDAKKPIKNSDMPIYIGNWFVKDRPFNGKIREVRISDDNLTLAKIKSNWLKLQKKLNKLWFVRAIKY